MRISDWSSDVCSSDLWCQRSQHQCQPDECDQHVPPKEIPSGRGCANSGVRATIAVFVQPTETMYRILTLAAASLAALLAFSACTSQAVLNDLTTDKGSTLTADVPYDREHHLTPDVSHPHNEQTAPRTEDQRGGKDWGGTGKSRGAP